MSGKIEYLEKYSIAPPPSRDYYGLRLLDDQVIIYRWKISHGPHKLPIVRAINFDDFAQDKLLQDEIRRIFGKYLLKYIRNIVSGRNNTLLTLPKCLIERLIKYLTVQDIVKLSSLSHVAKEIFDDNFVWEALYKKYKPLTRTQYNSVSYDWKRLFQQAQMQGLIKVPRSRPATRQAKASPKPDGSMKILGSGPKTSSKFIPIENQVSRKSAENVQKKITQNSVSRKPSDSRLDRSVIENEKDKKASIIRLLQTTTPKSMKSLRLQSSVTKIDSKLEIKETVKDKPTETKVGKTQNKARKIDAKISNASMKLLEDKEIDSTRLKLMGLRNTKTEKPVSRGVPGDQSKSKIKNKAKKVGQSKSTILSTSAALLNDQGLRSCVKNECLDLANLIEASLKNIHSPRSIFESTLEKSKFCGGDSKLHELSEKMIEPKRLLRSGRGNETLDRLSEKSEPLTAKSMNSGNKSNASPGSTKHKAVNVGTKKTVQNKREFNDELEFDAYFEQYYNKHIGPRSQEQKSSTLGKTMDKMDKLNLLRSLGGKNSNRKTTGVDSVPPANRYDLKKIVGNFHK